MKEPSRWPFVCQRNVSDSVTPIICVRMWVARTASPLREADRIPGPSKSRERLRKFEAARPPGPESRKNCQLAREIFAAAVLLSRNRILMTGAAARVTRRVTMPDRLPEERKESCHGGRDRLGREAGPATRGHQEPRYSSTSDLRRSKSSSGMLTKTKTGPSLSLRHTMDSTSSGFRSGG